MKNLIVLALLCALIASCKKDCEEDHTATLRVTNTADVPVYVNNWKEQIEVPAGKTKGIEFGLDINGTGELVGFGVVSYRWNSPTEKANETAVTFNQCQTTELTLEQ